MRPRLAIEASTSTDADLFWQIIGVLLKRIQRRMAVMVLKAFPLDYDGKEIVEPEMAFGRRQRALIHLYQRRLGAEPVPHKESAEVGWMLRPIYDGARPETAD